MASPINNESCLDEFGDDPVTVERLGRSVVIGQDGDDIVLSPELARNVARALMIAADMVEIATRRVMVN